MAKICCFFNYPPHYRFPIYKAMSEAFDCDFYFGDTIFEPLRQFDVHKLKGFKRFLHVVKTNFKGYLWYRGGLCLFNLKYKYYILTGQQFMLTNWLILFWAKIWGKKVLLWTHGIHEHMEPSVTKFVFRIFYTMPDVLLMYAKYNWWYMEEIGCKKSQCYVIHNSLDTALQSRLYAKLHPSDIFVEHFGNKAPVVIYIGRLQKRKKVDQLINAIIMAKSQGCLLNLVLVGEKTDAEDIESMVVNNSLSDNVWFYGPCFDEHINAELLYNSSVCVCPVAIGLTAIHALTYGCPVVSNDNIETQMPEFECIIDGKTGSLFQEDNISDLLEKIKYWCFLDDSQREQTRLLARQVILKEWSVDYQINLLKSILK